mmetsp:Transcript_44298/g.113104  ORF Transcript_44298/g.113104 Transcript_44298/m.113104 type:complete len:181 (-) Transcript_44298:165-707(-)|eukprot:jgi/Tetstr1/438333/TSEL_026900.t1
MSLWIEQWTVDQVCDWLYRMNAEEKVPLFRENNVTGSVLLTLSAGDLTQQLGFKEEEARALLDKLRSWITVMEEMQSDTRAEGQEGAGATIIPKEHQSIAALISQWSVSQVCKWVARVGLEHKVASFRANNVDGPVLLTLSEKDLLEDLRFSKEETAGFLEQLHHWVEVTERRLSGYQSA